MKRDFYFFVITLLVSTVVACTAAPVETVSNSDGPPRTYRDLIPWREKNGLYGYADRDGNLVIPAAYSNAERFSEGRGMVAVSDAEHGDLWGYIDEQGHWIVKPQFTHATGFHNGVAKAAIMDDTEDLSSRLFGGLGAIGAATGPVSRSHTGSCSIANYRLNRAGQTIEKWTRSGRYGDGDSCPSFNPEFLSPQEHERHDKEMATTSSSCGFEGKVYHFTDGYVDRFNGAYNDYYNDYAIVKSARGEGYGVIDKQCRLVVPFRDYDHYATDVEEGFVKLHRKGKGWGFLDVLHNREVSPFENSSDSVNGVRLMSGEMVAVQSGKSNNGIYQWSLIDAAGKSICSGSFEEFSYGGDGLIAARESKSRLWGALSPDGIWVIEPRYDYSFGFWNGFARIRSYENGRRDFRPFYIDRTGREFRAGGGEKTSSPLVGTHC